MMPKRNVYETKWFAKAARKADIADAELCEAIAEVEQGQADDLGGGVWKKRLRKNRWRGIVLTRYSTQWIRRRGWR
jgi:hypothetical protein